MQTFSDGTWAPLAYPVRGHRADGSHSFLQKKPAREGCLHNFTSTFSDKQKTKKGRNYEAGPAHFPGPAGLA